MMEILYNSTTGTVKAWCADPKQFGLFKPKPGQVVRVLPLELRDVPRGEDYVVDGDALIPQTPHVGTPDFKAQYGAANTPEAKMTIFAKMLGLEDE